MKFWTWFLTKKNLIVDCPDAEALAAFKHNIRDEWLARHLGQEKPKSMAALTTLMTRFCAGEDSWLARSNNTSRNPATPDNKDANEATANPDATNISAANMVDTPKIRQSMPDLAALSPVSGMGHSKMTIRARPVWTAYSTAHAKFMAPQEHQPIIPTENAGSSNKPAVQVLKTRRRGLKAMTTTRSPGHRTQEGKRNFPPVWTAYSTAHAKFMAPQEHQPIIPTENAGSSNKPAVQVLKTRRRGLKAMTTTRSPGHRTQEGKRNFPRKSKR